MKNRIKRLNALLALKQKIEQGRLSDYSRAEVLLREHGVKREQLGVYRADYVTKLNHRGGSGLSMQEVKHTIDFVEKLDVIIEQHAMELASIKEQVHITHIDYIQARKDVKSIECLIAKAQTHLNEQENREIQKLLDETIQNQWYYRRRDDNSN